MDKDLLWSKILDKIQSELNSLAYQTWFSETELYKLDNGIAKIIVPYAIHKQHIINNYKDLLNKCFNELTQSNYELELLLKEDIEEEEPLIIETFKTEEVKETYQISKLLYLKLFKK